MKAIKNATILEKSMYGHIEPVDNHVLLYTDKVIQLAPTNYFAHSQADEVMDAEGLIVAPGFFNTHIHGALGYDIMDNTVEAMEAIAMHEAKAGVTAFLATTMTMPMEAIYKTLDFVREYQKTKHRGAKVLGVHLEGPFINPLNIGAQNPNYIIPADFSLIENYADVIKLITFAPEMLPPESDFIEKCTNAGITLSLGHSNADYDEAMAAVSHGIRRFTHLCNGQMTPLHHRKPGAVGAGLDSDVYTELIMDNIHISPMFQRLCYKVKGKERLIAVTDAIDACGIKGKTMRGGQEVFVTETGARLANGTLAGSVATMDDCLRNLMTNADLAPWDAIETATLTPAKSLGLDKQLGAIKQGMPADFVLVDWELNVKATIVGGEVVYQA